MKLVFLVFSLLCIHTASPVKTIAKEAAKKAVIATTPYKMAPSILIVSTY